MNVPVHTALERVAVAALAFQTPVARHGPGDNFAKERTYILIMGPSARKFEPKNRANLQPDRS